MLYSFQLFFDFIGQYPWTVAFYMICTFLSYPIESIFLPRLYSSFFEEIRKNSTQEVFLFYFGLLFLLLIVVNLANYITLVIEADLLPEWKGFFMDWIFKHLLLLYENQMTDIELGKIIVDLIFFPHNTKIIISEFTTWILPRILSICIVNLYLFTIDPYLGLLSFGLLIIYAILSWHLFRVCKPLAETEHTQFEEKMQSTQDRLSNTFSIYSVGNMQKEITKFMQETEAYITQDKAKMSCLNHAGLYTALFIILMMLLINGYGSLLFMRKKIPFPTLMTVFMVVMYYIPSVVTVNNELPGMTVKYAVLESKDNFIENLYKTGPGPGLVSSKGGAKDKPLKTGKIDIRQLTFAYTPEWAIMGPSGSGKSSLIKLIMGYYPVPDGTIFIDGQDINQYDLNSLRRQISYVNQNTKLFNMSLLENICYGNEETCSREKITKLIRQLGVQEVYRNIDLDDSCGIDGNKLSGGQRQIVHLLRCILRKNHIVILDEPTSALDEELKGAVIRAIRVLSQQATLIIITHDDSLLFLVDRVIRMGET